MSSGHSTTNNSSGARSAAHQPRPSISPAASAAALAPSRAGNVLASAVSATTGTMGDEQFKDVVGRLINQLPLMPDQVPEIRAQILTALRQSYAQAAVQPNAAATPPPPVQILLNNVRMMASPPDLARNRSNSPALNNRIEVQQQYQAPRRQQQQQPQAQRRRRRRRRRDRRAEGIGAHPADDASSSDSSETTDEEPDYVNFPLVARRFSEAGRNRVAAAAQAAGDHYHARVANPADRERAAAQAAAARAGRGAPAQAAAAPAQVVADHTEARPNRPNNPSLWSNINRLGRMVVRSASRLAHGVTGRRRERRPTPPPSPFEQYRAMAVAAPSREPVRQNEPMQGAAGQRVERPACPASQPVRLVMPVLIQSVGPNGKDNFEDLIRRSASPPRASASGGSSTSKGPTPPDLSFFNNYESAVRAPPNRALQPTPIYQNLAEAAAMTNDAANAANAAMRRQLSRLLNVSRFGLYDPKNSRSTPMSWAKKVFSTANMTRDVAMLPLENELGQLNRELHEVEKVFVTYMSRLRDALTFHIEKKGRVSRYLVKVDLDNMQLLYQQYNRGNSNKLDVRNAQAIDVTSMHELRRNGDSWWARLRHQAHGRMSLFYGKGFVLKNLKFMPTSEAASGLAHNVLAAMMRKMQLAPYDMQLELYLRKEFLKLDVDLSENMDAKALKGFLNRNGVDCSPMLMRKFGADYDSIPWGYFYRTFIDYVLYDIRILSVALKAHLVNAHVDLTPVFDGIHPATYAFTFEQLAAFLATNVADDFRPRLPPLAGAEARRLIRSTYTMSDVQTSNNYLAKRLYNGIHVINMLYSDENELWDRKRAGKVNVEAMNRPLAEYWIFSSHNTYLTGDQIYSSSSIECYIRALKLGCRSIEIDCWNGDDGRPKVYHGYTMTSKLDFEEVVHAIDKHAFDTTPYPLVISIEDHCNNEQQRIMASIFKRVFGTKLVTAAVGGHFDRLPSPNELKHRIILKHTKFEKHYEPTPMDMLPEWIDPNEINVANYEKTGFLLMMSNMVSGEWKPHYLLLSRGCRLHFFVPTDRDVLGMQGAKLKVWGVVDDATPLLDEENVFGQVVAAAAAAAAEGDDDDRETPTQVDKYTLHLDEPWFYGEQSLDRQQVIAYATHANRQNEGMFLVRKSGSVTCAFALSVYSPKYDVLVNIMIREKILSSTTRLYSIEESPKFDCIWDMVQYYRTHKFYMERHCWKLSDPIYPAVVDHLGQKWFLCTCTKLQAEAALRHDPQEGAFIIRLSDHADTYTLSVFAFGLVTHVRLRRQGRMYTLFSEHAFATLSDLVAFYEVNPIMKDGPKLLTSYSETLHDILLLYANIERQIGYGDAEIDGYLDMDAANQQPKTMVATQTYMARKANELSFPMHAIILNVCRIHANWYRGDYGGHKGGWFPVSTAEEVREDQINREIARKRTSQFVGLEGVTVAVINKVDDQGMYALELRVGTEVVSRFGSKQLSEIEEWAKAIKAAARVANRGPTASASNGNGGGNGGRLNEHMRTLANLFRKPFRLNKELGDLFHYCQAISEIPMEPKESPITDMVSIAESKIDRWFPAGSLVLSAEALAKFRALVVYCRTHLVRVYPKGTRIDSSNFNPVLMWASGVQMAALNLQKNDMAMNINSAMFEMQNGGAGYVPKPAWLQAAASTFNPFNVSTVPSCVASFDLTLTVIAGRLINRPKGHRGTVSPIVKVKIIGCEFDCSEVETKQSTDNGINPFWNEVFQLRIRVPEMAFIRFLLVERENVASQSGKFLGQATYPVAAIRSGVRNVALRDTHNEKLEMSRLLVKVERTLLPGSPARTPLFRR